MSTIDADARENVAASSSEMEPESELSLAQKYAFQQFRVGETMLVSGPAGTGKSHLIKICREYADATGRPFQITATTGTAAVLLGEMARTIHSWAGLGIGRDGVEKLLFKMRYKPKLTAEIRAAYTLVVDEVSMLSKDLLDLMDGVFRGVRQDSRPFGGIQLLLFGDFFQLPPITDRSQPESGAFCFDSNIFRSVFKTSKRNMIELTKIFRQKDPLFSRVLNEIRIGELSSEGEALLRTRLNVQDTDESGIRATRIFPRRDAVDGCNYAELAKLSTPSFFFKMKEHFNNALTREEVCKKEKISNTDINNEFTMLRRNLLCDDEIELKVGAQVMNVRNTILPSGLLLPNGAQGIVIKFIANEESVTVPVVRFNNGVTMQMKHQFFESPNIKNVGLVQLPLRLAWAVTIHKAQGTTLDKAEMDLGSSMFESGQTYSAISRLRTLEGLFLTAFDPSKIVAHADVKNFYKRMTPVTEDMLLQEEQVEERAKKLSVHFVRVLAPQIPSADLFSDDNERIIPMRKRKAVDLFSDDSEEPEPQENVKVVKTGPQSSPFFAYRNE